MTPYMLIFDIALAIHIATGAVGLVTFWIPVVGRKGDDRHRWWGRIFARCNPTAGSAPS